MQIQENISLKRYNTFGIDANARYFAKFQSLNELEEFDAQQCRVVELRYFAGLTIEETAEVLKISPATVKREWAIARAWLYQRIRSEG